MKKCISDGNNRSLVTIDMVIAGFPSSFRQYRSNSAHGLSYGLLFWCWVWIQAYGSRRSIATAQLGFLTCCRWAAQVGRAKRASTAPPPPPPARLCAIRSTRLCQTNVAFGAVWITGTYVSYGRVVNENPQYAPIPRQTWVDTSWHQGSTWVPTVARQKGSCRRGQALHCSCSILQKAIVTTDQGTYLPGGPALSLGLSTGSQGSQFLWGVLGVKGGCENGRILATPTGIFCHTASTVTPSTFPLRRRWPMVRYKNHFAPVLHV